MSWRDTKVAGDIITAEDENIRTAYIVGHNTQHQINGEQPINHNLLTNYDETKHRKITLNDAMGVIIIEI